MKHLLIITLLVLAASLSYRLYGGAQAGTGSLTLPQPAPNTGENAPLFDAIRGDGNYFELSEKGVYVLTFWSSTEVPFLGTLNKATAEARPEFDRLARDYEDQGVSFAAIYVSYPPEGEGDIPYAVLGDNAGELAALYNVKRVPRLFLISDGQIELVQNGYYPENEERLREELDRVLSERI